MGIIQEGAIYIGDHLTQPIRAKIASMRTGDKVRIEKVVTHSFVEDLFDLDDKRVNWYLRTEPRNHQQ